MGILFENESLNQHDSFDQDEHHDCLGFTVLRINRGYWWNYGVNENPAYKNDEKHEEDYKLIKFKHPILMSPAIA